MNNPEKAHRESEEIAEIITFAKVFAAFLDAPLYVFRSEVGIHVEMAAPSRRKFHKVRPDGSMSTYGDEWEPSHRFHVGRFTDRPMMPESR